MLFVFCAIFGLIAYLLPIPKDNDMYAHATIAKNILVGDWSFFSRPFIMYSLSIVLSFFSENTYNILIAICILLAASTAFRYYISLKEISKINVSSNKNKNLKISGWAALSLIFVFVIPVFTYMKYNFFYIGNFTPTVWHNSTIIFLMPFAVLLFIESCKQIENYSPKRDFIIFSLIFLNIFIKPSFFFVFAVAYPLIMLLINRVSKKFFRSLIPIILGGILLLLQYWLMYQVNDEDVSGKSGSGISLGFFTLYSIRIGLRFLPICLLLSLLFPILYTLLNFRKITKDIIYLFSISLVIFSILIYAGVHETGPRFLDGNFYWQIIPCTWILFFVSLVELLKDIRENGFILKNKFLLTIYSLHVISGIIYLLYIIIEGNYA